MKEPLTRREWQVARTLATGSTNQQIANELRIGRRTVETHVAHVMAKLVARSCTQVSVRLTEEPDRLSSIQGE